MRMRGSSWFKLLLICMWFFPFLIGQGLAQDQGTGVRVAVAILAPPNGFITLDPTIEVRGTASTSAEPGVGIDVVIVSVNGIPQKAALGEDGTFQAMVELAYGENIISAVAVASNNEIGSDRVSVILQREVLFFDDFEGKEVRPEWAMVTGRWILVEQDPETRNKAFTVQEQDYGDRWESHLVTTSWALVNEGFAWQDYAVEVDVLNNTGWLHYWYGDSGRKQQGLYVAVRARDPQNLVAFEIRSDALGEGHGDPYEGWMCWRVIRGGVWSDCINTVKPSPPPNFRLRVEVKEDLFTAYINGAPVSSWRDRDNEFPQGTAGLGIWHKFKGAKGAFDNFKVISLEGRGTAPAYTGELPESPTQVSVEEWQEAVGQLEREVKPTLATLQTSLGGYELKLKDLRDRVSSLESTLGERLEPLRLRVDRLDSRYRVLETRVEGLSQLITKVPPDIDLRLSSFQEGISAHDREIQALKGDLKGIGNVARLGLIAGAAGLILAGLALLGVIS